MVAILKEPYPQLRPMHEDDLEQVTAIEVQGYEYPWTLTIFRDCLRAGYQCRVLAHAVEVVGYGILSVAAGDAWLNVCVTPAQRWLRQRLMHGLIDMARWHRVQLSSSVRPSNTHAIKLYQLGFNGSAGARTTTTANAGACMVMAMELLAG